MSDFNINKSDNAIIPYLNINEEILKRFCACLMIEGKSEKTIKKYRRTVNCLSEVVKKHFTDIGVYDIRLFLAYEKQRGVSNRTLENTRADISAFYQWLTREEIIPKNPCLNIPPIKYTDKVKLPFSTVEIDLLRSVCKNNKERALVEFLLATGVRVSELTSMKISDINFQNLSIHITHGKGDKERTTYMTDLAKTYLEKYINERCENGDCLFYNKDHQPIQISGVRYILGRIGKRACVENVHPHRFRRTFASMLAARGMDIQEIKRLLGHSNINTTMEYVYTSDGQVHNSYKKYIA